MKLIQSIINVPNLIVTIFILKYVKLKDLEKKCNMNKLKSIIEQVNKKIVDSIWLTLLIKLDFPTLGNPQINRVLVLGSMDGRRDKCWRTCSK